MENSIEIRDLTCRYPSFALEGINLEVPCGTVLGLIGENGAGKSTLIKAVLGLIRPENGSIAVLGEDSTKLTPAVKEDIGVVFDELPFPREMTAKQLDRVLGGGIVGGSAVLLGGDPGIGKSTLLMQMAGSLTNQGSVLYVTGEESAAQLKLRAQRLGAGGDMLLLAETDITLIESEIELIKPAFLIIDSIQTMY